MPNGDSTANVGDLVEIESQGYPLLRVADEIDQLGISDVRTYGGRGWHPKKFEFNELIETNKAT